MVERPKLEVGLTIEAGAPRVDRCGLAELLEFAATIEQSDGEVGVWICTDDDIADLHQRFMNVPGPTDVLSFPGDEPYLGDIAVSFETAEAQSLDAGQSVQREIAYLVLHGFLHLLGYDDLTAQDRDRMLQRQDELMDQYERGTGHGWH